MKIYINAIIKILLMLVIVNGLFYVLSQKLGISRGLVNIDYFIPVFCILYNQRLLYYLSSLLVICIDFLLLFGQIFPVIHPENLLYLMKFSLMVSDDYKLYVVLIIGAIVLQIFLIKKIYSVERSKTQIVANLFIFNILIFCLAVFNNGLIQKAPKKGNFWKPKTDFVVSQLWNYYNYFQGSFLRTYNMTGETFQKVKVIGATKPLWENIKKYNKTLLIINESWGVPTNKNIQDDILQPLLIQQSVQNVTQKNLDIIGYTISAELRELCQKVPNHFNLKKQLTGFERCLPHLYKQAGYKTTAVHGALSNMYDRKYWYPRAGFDEMLFRDMGLNLPHSFCYSFPGNCDSDITSRVKMQFEQHDKIFLYWLTLTTHSVYDLRDLRVDLFDCHKFNVVTDSASCRNLKLQKQFFYFLADMLNSEEFRGTKVIVVGDHEPPIISIEKSAFYENKVPSITFEIAK